jgi:hypothetical protein
VVRFAEDALLVGIDVFVHEDPQTELQVFDFLAECEIHLRSLRFRSNLSIRFHAWFPGIEPDRVRDSILATRLAPCQHSRAWKTRVII